METQPLVGTAELAPLFDSLTATITQTGIAVVGLIFASLAFIWVIKMVRR